MFFPVFIDLSKKKILFVGAGHIAARRIRVLSGFTENITVISPEIAQEIGALDGASGFTVIRREVREEDLAGYDIVFAATNDEALNQQIHEICQEKGIPVNVCSDQSLCDFFFPSVVSDGEVVIGINASGRDHTRVKETRQRIEAALGIGEEHTNYRG